MGTKTVEQLFADVDRSLSRLKDYIVTIKETQGGEENAASRQ